MGYGVMPYRLKMDALCALYGSNNKTLKPALARELKMLDDFLDVADGWEPAEQLLDQYLNGDPAFFECEHSGTKEWNIIEAIVGKFGKMLNNGAWYPTRDIDVLYEIASMYRLDKERKFKLKEPFDFPAVFTIFNSNLETAKTAVEAYEMPAAQKNELLKWIAEAGKTGEDLMLFYH